MFGLRNIAAEFDKYCRNILKILQQNLENIAAESWRDCTVDQI